jgi:hypothetical protein
VLTSLIGTPRSRAITALTIGPHSRPGRARAAADDRLNLIGSGRAQPHRTADLAGGDFLEAAERSG